MWNRRIRSRFQLGMFNDPNFKNAYGKELLFPDFYITQATRVLSGELLRKFPRTQKKFSPDA